MAITDKEQGVWNLDEVYNKINQGSIWSYDGLNAQYWWGYGGGNSTNPMNDEVSRSSPIQVPGWNSTATDASPVSLQMRNGGISGTGAQFLRSDGTIWSSGYNANGILGLNQPENTERSSPTQIGTASDWAHVATSGHPGGQVHATNTSNETWAWGNNAYGQLGQNETTGSGISSPIQIAGSWEGTAWSSGANTAHGIKTDGTLWGIGYGGGGQIGENNRTSRSSPTQVGTETTWRNINNWGGVLATKTDGTLWGWGSNQYGTLGLNNRSGYSSPQQVGTDTNWKYASGSDDTSYFMKTNGTMWVCGRNDMGQHGDNQAAPSHSGSVSSPKQISGTTWDHFMSYQTSVFATKTDGTMWSWGSNPNGKLGLNDNVQRSSPTQVGTGTNWKLPGGGTLMGGNSMMAQSTL